LSKDYHKNPQMGKFMARIHPSCGSGDTGRH